LYLLIGAVIGGAYSLLDGFLDHRLHTLHGPERDAYRLLHKIVDGVVPVFVGLLTAVALFYYRSRSELAMLEHARAEEASARAERLERDQAVWLVAAATLHQVANPLHTLGLLCDDLARLGRDAHDERDRLIESCRAQMRTVGATLQQLRSLPSVRRPELMPLELAPLLEETISRLLAATNVTLSVNAEPKGLLGKADARYLRVIVENLIDNGVEAMARTPHPQIALRVFERDGRTIIAVSDNGPGIAPEVAATLFDPLGGSDSERHFGIGLSIGRALAQAMRGDLAYVGKVGGAVFELSLERA
jgi:two-component system C4-dicarboxylate transport sensor histidine kinase DctB